MGERFDFKKMKITETGGIYVRSFPAADQVTIDYGIKEKPGIFSNSIFVQSLLPDEHTVLVEKSDYYDYFKKIPVQEEEVTKLENILLFKKNIQYSLVADQTLSPFIAKDKFVIKNNNLYYSNIKENSNLTAIQKSTPVIKKIVTFIIQNNNVVWLGLDGFLYKSDASNLATTPLKVTLTPIKIKKAGIYKIISDGGDTFVNNDGNLLWLNNKTNNLDNFYSPVKGADISPDGTEIIYYDDNNIYISPLPNVPVAKNTIYKSADKINDCIWLNSSYIIFTSGNKIIISEIDYRGNINSTVLAETVTISPTQQIKIENPQIFFNQQEGKLYILTNKTLLVSEKITT
jgi:hypothetical protein